MTDTKRPTPVDLEQFEGMGVFEIWLITEVDHDLVPAIIADLKATRSERDKAIKALRDAVDDIQEYHDSFAKPPVIGRLKKSIRLHRALLREMGVE